MGLPGWARAELRSPGARHSSAILAGRVGQIGCGFLASVLLARSLGASQFGLVAVISVAYVAADTLADLGLTAATVRAVARARSEEPSRVRALVHGYASLAVLANVLVAVVGIALAEPISRLLLGRPEAEGPLRLALLGLGSAALNGLAITLLHALSSFGRLAIVQTATSLSYLLGVAVLAALGRLDVTSVVLLGVVNPLLGFFVGLRLLPPGFLSLGEVLDREARSAWRELVAFGRWIWISSVMLVPALRLDLLLLSHWAAAGTVGAYALAVSVAMRLNLVTSTRYTVLLPTAAALVTAGEANTYVRGSLGRSLLLAAPFVLGVPLADPLVTLFYGPQFVEAVPALQIMLVAVIVELVATPLLLLAYPLNAPRVLALSDGIRVATVAVACFLLIPTLGAAGAALARLLALIAGCAVAIAVLWWIARRALATTPVVEASDLPA